MGIKVGSLDVSDIQVNLNGTLTPVNIVKIGGSSTNLWVRDHSNNGSWSNGDITVVWSAASNTFIDEDDFYQLYYDSSAAGWFFGTIEESNFTAGTKYDSQITFSGYGTFVWSAS